MVMHKHANEPAAMEALSTFEVESAKKSDMRILVNDHAGHPFQVQLSRNLASRGHQVLHTYCASVRTPHGDLTKKTQDPPGFDIVPIQLPMEFNRYGLLSRWQQEKQLGNKVAHVISNYEPDAVISANTPLRTQSAVLAAVHKINARFIFWVQDFLGIGIAKVLRKKWSFPGILIGKWFEYYEKRLLQKSDHIVLISKDHLSQINGKRFRHHHISIIENWGPLNEIQVMPKANSWSLKHELAQKFCFLYAGTLGMKHNPELIVQLGRKLKGIEDSCIVVISEGPGADYLKNKKEADRLDNLLLLDFQPYDLLPQVLGAADVLMAILEEDAGCYSVPSKVLTYLCAQRPLLLAVPPDNLAARIVAENEAGMVVRPTDTNGFVKSGLELKNNRELRNRLARNGLKYARKTFNVENITDQFEAIIRASK